jgi:hypothetical protein
MRKLLMILIGVLALVVPAGAIAAGSPKWTAYPSCTASTTTLTCTGRAVAVHPQSMPNLGPLGVAVFGRLLYTCLEPYFQTDWSGSFLNGNVLSSVNYKSGRSFSISYDAPYSPPTMNAGAQCLSGLWARPDSNYYDVDVKVGWGWGGSAIEALDAPIGTVLAP